MAIRRDFVSEAVTSNGVGGQLQIDLDIARGRIAVTGELELATVHVFREAAMLLLSKTAPEITIDLGGLQFIDAAGIGEIVRLRLTLIAADRRLTLSRPALSIRRTFAAGGLTELLRAGESSPRPASWTARSPSGGYRVARARPDRHA
jgi:anti-anti-sigma factor